MKTLVTHINPHLDDISAIWLFKKFFPEFRDAEINFINASRDAAFKEETDEKIFFGTGGGKYDEHKGDLEDCAASLVWKDIKSSGIGPTDEIQLKALDALIEWNRLTEADKGFLVSIIGEFYIAKIDPDCKAVNLTFYDGKDGYVYADAACMEKRKVEA